jgi:type IV secretory pathway TrbL component
MMHGHEKSDEAIVAVKPANKVELFAAEPVEPRAEAKGNARQQSTCGTQGQISVSKAMARIRQIVAVDTRGGSRMRESRTYGSGAARLAAILAGESPANRGVQSLL